MNKATDLKWLYLRTIWLLLMKQTIKTSGKFKFLEVGTGKPIVILHGLMGGLSNFQGVTDYFPTKGTNPMLPIYDLPC